MTALSRAGMAPGQKLSYLCAEKLPTQLISQPTPGILVNWLTKRLQK
jgi:hypothetical protein